jgi:NO-binding membrane sensor protein with MHYT domain
LNAAVLAAAHDVIRCSVPNKSTRSLLAWHETSFPIDGFRINVVITLAVHETHDIARRLLFSARTMSGACTSLHFVSSVSATCGILPRMPLRMYDKIWLAVAAVTVLLAVCDLAITILR